MVTFGGDFRFFWPENIKDFVTFPSAWDSSLNTGVGHSQLPSLWITSYFNLTTFLTNLGLDWNLIQVLFWILPAFVISFLSSFFLFKNLFKDTKFSIISGLIYSLNTYFLMVLTGGQLGVSLAYSLVPLVLLRFVKLFDYPNVRNSILCGLALSLQVIFDPRIVFITLIAVFLYSIFNLSKLKKITNKIILLTPFGITVLLNFFWILPLVLTKSSAIPVGFDSVSGFKFFSFAEFSNGLSLLHPNWPENIFGKVYFLDPKFLILPILAFSSLLFVRTMKQSSNRTIFFFSILALLGVFFAKGANPPFGEVNQFLFEHFPGMSMFRDPTKWYVLIALSYSILIPSSVFKISEWVQSQTKVSSIKYQVSTIFFLSTLLYLLFLISPILGQIKIREVPHEYVQLKDFLDNQKTFSRTLWIPKWQRFGYFSNLHPAIGREELFKGNAGKQISQLDQNLLRNLSVKYIIVPYDSEGEIFLDDREYSEKRRQEAEKELDKINFLRKIERFNDSNHLSKIAIYEIKNPKDHFWSPSTSLGISYQMVKPTEYKVKIQNARKGDLLVFSEGFDKNWKAQSASIKYKQSLRFNKLKVSSIKYGSNLNSFVLPEGSYELKLYYEPQKWVNLGLIISLATLVGSIAFFKFV